MAYPALRTTKEDDKVGFQLSSASTLHISSSNVLERFRSNVALGADCFSTPRIDFAFARKKETLNVLFHREESNSQRPTHVHELSED